MTQLKPRHKSPRTSARTPLLPRAALPRYLTQDEVTRLFAVISSPRDRALFALIYHYGLRVEEATLLTLGDRLKSPYAYSPQQAAGDL